MPRKPVSIDMTCKRCGAPFIAHSPARRYCSTECQKLHYKETGRAKDSWTRANQKVQQKNWDTYSDEKQKCLICGAWVKAPAMHAYQAHGVTAHEYKEAFNIPYGVGLLPEELKKIKRDHVFDNGTVENLTKYGVPTRIKKGEPRRFDGVLRRYELGQTKRPLTTK